MATKRASKVVGEHRQRGLSLLEIAIVVAIVAATALPSFADLVAARRLDGAATRPAADIQFARREAIARNRTLRLSIRNGADATCWIVQNRQCRRLKGAARGGAPSAPAVDLASRSATLATDLGDGAYPAPTTCFAEGRKTVRFLIDGSLHVEDVALDASAAAFGLARWDETGDWFLAWHCAVAPRADGRWSGRIALVASGWTIGTGPGDGRSAASQPATTGRRSMRTSRVRVSTTTSTQRCSSATSLSCAAATRAPAHQRPEQHQP